MKGNRPQPALERPITCDTADLVGAHEIAERLGWNGSTVQNWSVRYDDFPPPVRWLHCGRLWHWPAVLAWAQKTGRGPIE